MRLTSLMALLLLVASPTMAADPFSLLPDSSDTMVGFDLKSSRAYGVYRRLQRNWAPKIDELVGLGGQTSSQQVADSIDRVTVGLHANSEDAPLALAVVEGDLKAAPWGVVLSDRFASAGERGGVTLYERKQEPTDAPFVVAFLSDSLALTGAMDAVLEGIDRYQQTLTHRSERVAALEQEARLAQTRGQTWMVTDDPVSGAASSGIGGGMASLLGSLRSVSVSANIATGLDLAIVGRCASDGEASTLAAMAQGVLAMARMGVPAEQGPVREALAAVRVNGEADRLELRAQLSEAQWMELMSMADGLRKEALP